MRSYVSRRYLIAISHLLETDDVYRGYRLPADSVVVPNTWAILHDEARLLPWLLQRLHPSL